MTGSKSIILWCNVATIMWVWSVSYVTSTQLTTTTTNNNNNNNKNSTVHIPSKNATRTIQKIYIPYNISDVFHYQNASKTSFITLYHGSQGSTWFMETLSEFIGICVVGNELIDRVKDKYRRLAFIEQATQAPVDNLVEFKKWKTSMYDLATEPPSVYDSKIFDKCTSYESVFGFKARLSFEEMKYVLSDNVQSRLGIKLIILSRNPVKQAISAYRRDFEHRDQRIFNMIVHLAEEKCKNRTIADAECKKRQDDLEAAKKYQSSIDFGKFKNEIFVHLNYYQERAKELRALSLGYYNNSVLHVSYEDMMHGMDAIMRDRILPFLGLTREFRHAQKDEKKMSKDYFREKATQDLLCDAVGNYAALCDYVRTNMSVIQRNNIIFSGPVGPEKKTLLAYFNSDACSELQLNTTAPRRRENDTPPVCCKKCCQRTSTNNPNCV